MNPAYKYPVSKIITIIGGLISGKHRSFQADARELFTHQPGLLEVQGEKFIPESGPCVITFNHYHRTGFHAWWLALAISSIIPREIHWVVTNELTFLDKWFGFAGRPISRMLLKRFSKIYNFTPMPPMPPRPKDSTARARSVHQVLDFIKHHKQPMIGLAPEGSDQQDGILSMPAPGSGRFGLLLSSKGLLFSPLGIYESDGKLILRFGPQYTLDISDNLNSQHKDQNAAREIMQHIADLLPDQLRGDFA